MSTKENIDSIPYEQETLTSLAKKIDEEIKQSDAHIFKAAKMLLVARNRVEGGELGNLTWTQWVKDNLTIGESRVKELLQIAKSDNPQKELATQRDKNKKRQIKHRAKQVAQPSPKTVSQPPLRNGGNVHPKTPELAKKSAPEQESVTNKQRLLNWVQQASGDDIQQVLEFIESLNSQSATCDSKVVSFSPSAVN